MPKHARTDKRTEEFLEDEYPDAVESLEPEVVAPLLFDDERSAQAGMVVAEQTGKRGRHGDRADRPELSAQQKKSRRMRRLLIVVVILLIALIGALGYFTWMLFQESQNLATQQAQQQSDQEVDALQGSEAQDASTATAKTTEVPDLAQLMGMTEDEAVDALKRGATVSSERQVNEEGNPMKRSLTVALTDEPADSRLGTPTVYLGLDEDDAVVMSGYSAAMSALGFGTLSFADAVKNENIVEKTLGEAGIKVEAGTAELPEDKADYSTYASDGTTLVQEKCSFSGTVELDGAEYNWSAVLVYDYKLANASGNLADTIRQIYLYLETPGAEAEEPEATEAEGEGEGEPA